MSRSWMRISGGMRIWSCIIWRPEKPCWRRTMMWISSSTAMRNSGRWWKICGMRSILSISNTTLLKTTYYSIRSRIFWSRRRHRVWRSGFCSMPWAVVPCGTATGNGWMKRVCRPRNFSRRSCGGFSFVSITATTGKLWSLTIKWLTWADLMSGRNILIWMKSSDTGEIPICGFAAVRYWGSRCDLF